MQQHVCAAAFFYWPLITRTIAITQGLHGFCVGDAGRRKRWRKTVVQSPFAPTKKCSSTFVLLRFLLAAHYSNLRRFPFSLCETAVVQTTEGNSTEFAFANSTSHIRAHRLLSHTSCAFTSVSACFFSPSVKNHRFLPPPSSEGGRQAYSTQNRNGAKTCFRKTSATFPVFALRNGGCSNRRGKLDGVRFCELQ